MLDRINARTHNKACEEREFQAAINGKQLKLPRINFKDYVEPESEENKEKQDKAFDYLSKRYKKASDGNKQ